LPFVFTQGCDKVMRFSYKETRWLRFDLAMVANCTCSVTLDDIEVGLLTERVLTLTGASNIEWCDFRFTKGISARDNYGDRELKGLDFLEANNPVRSAWSKCWPQTGNIQNWDAVAQMRFLNDDDSGAWLLVEAKGNLEELKSSCDAKSSSVGGGREQIECALNQAKVAFQVRGNPDWCQPYYQYANRLAILHFLWREKIATQLLFVYFIGDSTPGKSCPPDAKGWLSALNEMKRHLGLDENSPFNNRIYELFISVGADCPSDVNSV